MNNPYNPYRFKQVFTIWEAAAVIHEKYTIDEKDRAELQVMMNNLEYAIRNKELPGEIAVDSEYPHFYLTTRDFWSGSEIKRADLEEWCDQHGLRPSLLFPNETQELPPDSLPFSGVKSSKEALFRIIAALVVILASNCGDKSVDQKKPTLPTIRRYLKKDGKTINRSALERDMQLVLDLLGVSGTGIGKNSINALIPAILPEGKVPENLPENLAAEIIKALI